LALYPLLELPVMEMYEKALKLVDYLQTLASFRFVDPIEGRYHHMGATITDAILQAGINYKTVVHPRVCRIRKIYPEAVTTSAFWHLLNKEGVKQVLLWEDDEKPNRVVALTHFFLSEGIESEDDLARWLKDKINKARLLKVRGVGPKTADYLMILVGMQTAAADRYVFSILEEAGVATSNYDEARNILNLAADAMGVNRAFLDYSIWQYMSTRKRKLRPSCQE